ncbi:serine/threonine-protein kinase Smg1 [Anopheles bellator]|uniref:serine/threonine-protein kinase Smg1 n=1 Tax=Anopheles bellator TaxID=139047 RepID=UPI0026481F2E|nr:serine/threonine-protein kinase Smg1 [Anopheles bellator]
MSRQSVKMSENADNDGMDRSGKQSEMPIGQHLTNEQTNALDVPHARKKKNADVQQKPKTTGAVSEQGNSRIGNQDVGITMPSKRYQNTRRGNQTHKVCSSGASLPSTVMTAVSSHGLASYETLLANLPEDMRISKLLRRLAAEESLCGCRELCDKLEVVIVDNANSAYVRKSFELLANTIFSVLQTCPSECQDRVASIFGLMLFVVLRDSTNGTTLSDWSKRYMCKSKRHRQASLVALRQAVRLDRTQSQLGGSVEQLILLLQELLELPDIGVDMFILIADIMIELAINYSEQFESHFSDVVDIVVGWLLENNQKTVIKLHCVRVLLAFQPIWSQQREVTLSLIEQFLEDIGSCCDEIELNNLEELYTTNRVFGALLTAFNSVLKCLHFADGPSVSDKYSVDDPWAHFEDHCSIVFPVAEKILESGPPSHLELDAICEFTMLVLAVTGTTAVMEEDSRQSPATSIYYVLELLLRHLDAYSDQQLSCVIYLLIQIVESFVVDQSKRQPSIQSLVESMFDPTGAFYRIRYRRNETVRRGLLVLYHKILMIKNGMILQCVYRSLLADLNDAVGCLRQALLNTNLPQYHISLNLLILSPLAMTRNSVFITWTLAAQPVLCVLLELLEPLNMQLWAGYGELRYAIVLLAYQHANASNHFIVNSNLLLATLYRGNTIADRLGDSPSPTAEHFHLILRFLRAFIAQHTDDWLRTHPLPEEHVERLLMLTLDWCAEIFKQTERYYDVLEGCGEFGRLLVQVCVLSVGWGTLSAPIGLRCADCLDLVCRYVSLPSAVYQAIAEACCVQMCSVYNELRTRYTVVFSKLPLCHSLRQVNNVTGINRQRREEIHELKSVYLGTNMLPTAVLRMGDFSQLLNQIAFTWDGAYCADFLHELLTKSYGEQSSYEAMAVRDLRCLIPWAQWEAAQLCVNSKLRSPFGKPQETFLRIESIVKQNARILALTDHFEVRGVKTSAANQRHARILLGFLEALEKAIYNASSGTAFALPDPEKPVRIFFRTNASTCGEWFNRIRTAVDLVALHCMEPEMVIRYSEAVLRELVTANKISDGIFEHTLMSLVWALLRNWESDALYGVYVWSRQLKGRKYSWIRMAAEEAAGHRETAANGFRAILNDPASDGMDRYIRDFIVDQTILSMLFTGCYQELYEFLLSEERRGVPRATIPLITVTAEQILSIVRYEETLDANVIDLSQWELVELGTDIPNDFSCHKTICAVENTLSGIILNCQLDERERMLEACTELVQCYLQECMLTKCREYLFQITITNHILDKIARRCSSGDEGSVIRKPSETTSNDRGLRSHAEADVDDLGTLTVEKFYGTFTLMRLLSWSEFLVANAAPQGPEGVGVYQQQNIDLRLDMVSMGRKERNYALCRRELEKYYHKANVAQRLGLKIHRPTMEEIAGALIEVVTSNSKPPLLELWDENLSRAVYEHCKWLYCQSGKRYEGIEFAAYAAAGIYRLIMSGQASKGLAEREARFLLMIGGWLTSSADDVAVKIPAVQELAALLSPVAAKLPFSKQRRRTTLFGPCDLLVGSLLQEATQCFPDLAKVWFQFGSWLYRWGKRIVEFDGNGRFDGSQTISIEEVEAILLPGISSIDCALIVAVLNEHEVVVEKDNGVKDEEDGEFDLDLSSIGSVGLLQVLTKAVPALCSLPANLLDALVDVWCRNHRAIYGYYEAAAEAYFRFLMLSSSTTSAPDGRCKTAVNEKNAAIDSERASSVTVTLRLLRLIVKHALGLKEVLEEGLAMTPSEPWRVIAPQLFSRLAHHEPYVRKRVSELLCRVAKDAPHLIIFPAVVGSVREDNQVVSLLLDDVDELTGDRPQSVAPTDSGTGSTGSLAFCFNALLDILSREVPDTVRQVQTLVYELRRISLLWEELWLVSLEQIYVEYTKRLAAFESECQRLRDAGKLESRRQLLVEKQRLLLRPLVFLLEQLHAITSRSAETNHERHFQERYQRYINNMIEKLKEPVGDFGRPIEGWTRFRSLYSLLQQRSQRRYACHLRLIDVSPKLQQLSNTAIAMPGIGRERGAVGNGRPGSGNEQPILIRSVDSNIQILPTKTRPKKMIFNGNDGRRFGYLSKGLEDLHLDERIMQFLSIANLMMKKSIDCNGNVTHYRAEHYSVIPLGPRSGLITWVDDTVPIYTLYKRWQQREALQKREARDGYEGRKSREGRDGRVVLRPSELFYQKLTPLLNAHGLKTSDSRKEWPMALLKRVLAELQQETPRDLLAKELWCHSATASSWRQVVRCYSLSVAVMSVIGYIIGLGDRHLDNMLVKLATGEIVHIDYNVCFEKGHTLRVPERVPFRMTQNLEEALGITGIEGTFRLASEYVLKSLKRGRETLLTLLEAFVYDPLFDWAITEEAGGGPMPTATEITVSTMSTALSSGGDGSATLAKGGTTGSKFIGRAKRQLEREVTRDTLAIRFAECRVDWQQNRDELLQQVTRMQHLLKELVSVRGELRELDQKRVLLSQQMQLVSEAQYLDAFGSHPLASLAQRLAMRAKVQDERSALLNQMQDAMAEHQQHMDNYYKFRQAYANDRLVWLLAPLEPLLPSHAEHGWSPQLVAFLVETDPDDERATNIITFEGGCYARYCQARVHVNELLTDPAIACMREQLTYYGNLSNAFDLYIRPNVALLPLHPDIAYRNWYQQVLCSKDTSEEVVQGVLCEHKHLIDERIETDASAAVQLEHVAQLGKQRSEDWSQRLSSLRTSWRPQGSLASVLNEDINLPQTQNQTTTDSGLFLGRCYVTTMQIIELTHLLLQAERGFLMSPVDGRSVELDELFTFVRHLQVRCHELTGYAWPQITAPSITLAINRAYTVYKEVHRFHEHTTQFVLPLLSIAADLFPVVEPCALLQLDQRLEQLLEHIMNPPDKTSSGEKVSLAGIDLNESLAQVDELQWQWDEHIRALQDQAMRQHGETTVGCEGITVMVLLKQLNDTFDQVMEQGTGEPLAGDELIDDERLLRIVDIFVYAMNLGNSATVPAMQTLRAKLCNIARCQAIVQFVQGATYAVLRKGLQYDPVKLLAPLRTFVVRFLRLQLAGRTAMAVAGLCYAATQAISTQHASESMAHHLTSQHGAVHIVMAEYSCELYALLFVHQDPSFAGSIVLAKKHLQSLAPLVMRYYEQVFTEAQQCVLRHVCYRAESVVVGAEAIVQACTWLQGISEDSSACSRAGFLRLLEENVVKLTRLGSLLVEGTAATFTVCTDEMCRQLAWAAAIHPPLCHPDIVTNFQHHTVQQVRTLERFRITIDQLTRHASAVLRFEQVRNVFSEAVRKVSAKFRCLMEGHQKLQSKEVACATLVSHTEEALVELLDPEGVIDHTWISNVRALVDEMNDQLLTKIDRLTQNENTLQDALYIGGHKLRNAVTTHETIAGDIRSLLKTQLRFSESLALREYLQHYKRFLELLTEVCFVTLSKDYTDVLVDRVMLNIQEIIVLLPVVFEQLFQFDWPDDHEGEAVKAINVLPLTASSTAERSADAGTGADVGTNRHVQKDIRRREQKRNTHAVSVWRRIRMKLEGLDPNPNRRFGVSEQVNWMIQQAMDPSNLAVLYEGWTPWV